MLLMVEISCCSVFFLLSGYSIWHEEIRFDANRNKDVERMSKNSKDENEGKSQRVMKKEKQRRHSDRQYNLTVKGTENDQNYPIFL